MYTILVSLLFILSTLSLLYWVFHSDDFPSIVIGLLSYLFLFFMR